MELNSKLVWFLRVGLVAAIAFTFFWLQAQQRERDARAEKLRVVASVTAHSLICRDEREPFEVVIRNLAGRTVLEASFAMRELIPVAGVLPSDVPKVSLKAPLRPGEVQEGCYALNRYRLIARGVDPRSVQFVPMPLDVVFE